MIVQNSKTFASVAGAAALALTISGGPVAAQEPHELVVPGGVVLPVRLDRHLSSRDSWEGERFTATVEGTDYDYYRQLPPGTKVLGDVRAARPQEGDRPGILALDFEALRLPSGRTIPIDGSLIGLDNRSVIRRGDRLVALPSHNNDTLTYMGYGAGAGFILGTLTRHPIHKAMFGGFIGGLIGALSSSGDRGQPHDVNLDAGSRMGVRMNAPARILFHEGPGDAAAGAGHYEAGEDDAGAPPPDIPPAPRDGDRDRAGDRGGDRDRAHDRRDGDEIGVVVNDHAVNFNPAAAPIETDDHVILVPVAPVLIAAHISYRSDGEKTFIVRPDDNPIRGYVDSRVVRMPDGDRVRLEVPLQRIHDTVYAPIRFLELATGGHVTWDASSRTVLVDLPQHD